MTAGGQSRKSIRIAGIVFLFALFSINLFFLLAHREDYLGLLTRLSPDHKLESPGLVILNVQYAFVLGFLFWWIATKSGKRPIDPLAKLTIPVSLVLLLLFHLQPYLPRLQLLYVEDGFFESLTAICAFAASFLLAGSIRSARNWPIRRFLLVLAALFFVFGMEEISWGQRILGWKTPPGLSAFNYQNESNIHNFFNPILRFAYPIFNAGLAMFMFSVDRIRSAVERRSKDSPWTDLFPGGESSYYGFIFSALIFHSLASSTESTEIIVAVIGLSYAISRGFRGKPTSASVDGSRI